MESDFEQEFGRRTQPPVDASEFGQTPGMFPSLSAPMPPRTATFLPNTGASSSSSSSSNAFPVPNPVPSVSEGVRNYYDSENIATAGGTTERRRSRLHRTTEKPRYPSYSAYTPYPTPAPAPTKAPPKIQTQTSPDSDHLAQAEEFARLIAESQKKLKSSPEYMFMKRVCGFLGPNAHISMVLSNWQTLDARERVAAPSLTTLRSLAQVIRHTAQRRMYLSEFARTKGAAGEKRKSVRDKPLRVPPPPRIPEPKIENSSDSDVVGSAQDMGFVASPSLSTSGTPTRISLDPPLPNFDLNNESIDELTDEAHALEQIFRIELMQYAREVLRRARVLDRIEVAQAMQFDGVLEPTDAYTSALEVALREIKLKIPALAGAKPADYWVDAEVSSLLANLVAFKMIVFGKQNIFNGAIKLPEIPRMNYELDLIMQEMLYVRPGPQRTLILGRPATNAGSVVRKFQAQLAAAGVIDPPEPPVRQAGAFTDAINRTGPLFISSLLPPEW